MRWVVKNDRGQYLHEVSGPDRAMIGCSTLRNAMKFDDYCDTQDYLDFGEAKAVLSHHEACCKSAATALRKLASHWRKTADGRPAVAMATMHACAVDAELEAELLWPKDPKDRGR